MTIDHNGQELYDAREVGAIARLSQDAVMRRSAKLKIQPLLLPSINRKGTVPYWTKEQLKKIEATSFRWYMGHPVTRASWRLAVEVHGRMVVKAVGLSASDAVDLVNFYRHCGIRATMRDY